MSNDRANNPFRFAEAQDKRFSEPLQQLFSLLSTSDIAQFSRAHQLWTLHQQIDLLYLQIALTHQEIQQNQEKLHIVQPTALELSTLTQLQANGVSDTDLLDRLLSRGETWLDYAIQLLTYCERMGLIQGDYTQWCELALEGAYDWISSINEDTNEDDPSNTDNHRDRPSASAQDSATPSADYDEHAETLLLRKLFLEAGEDVPTEIEPVPTTPEPLADETIQPTTPTDLAVETPPYEEPTEAAPSLDEGTTDTTVISLDGLIEDIFPPEDLATTPSPVLLTAALPLDIPTADISPFAGLPEVASSSDENIEIIALSYENIEVVSPPDENTRIVAPSDESIENATSFDESIADISLLDDLSKVETLLIESIPAHHDIAEEPTQDLAIVTIETTPPDALPDNPPSHEEHEEHTEEIPPHNNSTEEISSENQISPDNQISEEITLKNNEGPSDDNSEDPSNQDLPGSAEQPTPDLDQSPVPLSTPQDGNALIVEQEPIAITIPATPALDTDQTLTQETEELNNPPPLAEEPSKAPDANEIPSSATRHTSFIARILRLFFPEV
jgi:hypothetical protein